MKTQIMNLFRMMEKSLKMGKSLKMERSGEMGKSLKSLKSLMQIFATYATYASAIFVGKESNESTVRDALWSRISLTKPLQNPYLTLTRFRLSLGSNLSRSRSACAPRTPSLFKDKSQLSFPSLASLICLCMLTVGVGNVWGAEEVVYTLEPANGTNNSYTGNCDVKINGITWNISGNSQQQPWRLGGKSITKVDRAIYSKNAISNNVTKIVITHGAASSITVNSMTVIVSTAQNGGGTVTSTLTPTFAANNDVTIDRPAGKDWSGKFYKIVYNVTVSGSSNKFVEFTRAKFYAETASKTLSSIAITTPPTTTKYLVGETFSKTGAVVTATYSDATTANVSASATWTPTTGLVAGSNTITASYTEGGVTKTATTTVTAYTVTVNKVDEDGTAIADAGVTASATGRTLSASGGSTNYVFKQWKFGTASGTSIASSSSASTSLTGTPTAAVTVIAEFYKPITITYKANGSTFTAQTYARGGTLAFPASNPDGATYSCTGKTFVGWVGEANKDYSHASTPPTYATAGGSVTTAATYYAVFATLGAATTATIKATDGDAGDFTGSGTSWSYTDSPVTISFSFAGNHYTSGDPNTFTIGKNSSTGTISIAGGIITQVVVNLSASTYYIRSVSSGASVSNVSDNKQTITFDSGSGTNVTMTGGSGNTTSDQCRITQMVISYKKSSAYETNCCTPLGSVNGSVTLSQLATPDPTKLKASWAMNAETGIASYTLKVYDSSDNLVKTIDNYTSGSEITGLTPCTTYYVELYTVSSSGSYCEGGLISTSSKTPAAGNTTHSYNVTFPTLTGTTKLTGNATACASGNYVATFEAANEAYELPTASGVTVTIGGSPATSGTDYTWAVSEGVGTLTIPTAKQTGDITIAVVSVAHSCSATPTLGAASLSGAFSLSSVGISCAGITPGSYCAVESGDYGFIWYEGTASDKKIGDTGVTKIAISTGDYSSGSFSTALSSTFVAGNTYTFRAFATNTGDNTGYSAESSFTPRSVTFNSNGGSAVATAYVNSGSAVSEPSAPTRTGYDFVKWQLNGADYSFSSAVNANITLDAVWDAKSYTVTLDQQSGSGGSENVSATYDADMPSATMPTRSGYTFGGYYGSEGGAGTQYYAADGSSAHTWDVADAKTLYAQWTAKNYTITLNNEGADSGKEGTESISVTFDANTNLTSAITKPVKDGYKFGGYYTEEDGSGTQIIDENGNVNASVTSYTSATKQWIYANDIELHAYWKPSYTVTWSVNGETTTEQVVSGEQVASLPTAPTSSDCDDAKVFVGWRATAIAGVSAANPGSIFTTQATSPAITSDVTFYAVFADVSARQAITLTFPDDNSSYNGSSSYTSTWTAKAGTFSFTVSNFNNNNWTTWTYIKCGRKDYTSVGTITTDNAISFRVDSVYVTLDAINDSKVNSAKVYVSGTSDFATSSNIDIPKSTGVKGMKFASPAAEKYYKIAFDCASGSSNGFVQISKVVFAQKSDTANYVTSCSSCDADATFTNTTPAVSAIDCDAATLTATGGLATLGADGCNVSDYGFVIGTTDNPAIGGSGVTKLQVGTTNPTIGADFSYDATGLTKGTHYYIRAYATNRHGTAYSGSQNFWTKGVSSIAITTAPTKTTYIAGESFDASGMVVKATLVDGTTPDVTGDVTYTTTGLSAGTNQDFAINYSLCGDNVSTNQKINVYAMTVTEGTEDDKGVVTYTSGATFSISSLATHWTANIVVTNGTANDNGDGTYTVTPSGAGAVSVTVNYVEAAQVKVYYKVDGVTVTGLTRDVYQSETTTLPTASELATAMTAQGMDIPDDSYPNFVGWSETEFGAQTSEPTLVTGTPTINAEKTYYAVYTNLGKKTILPTDFPNSYGDGDRVIDGVTYYRSGVAKPSSSIQFRSSKNGLGYIYSKTSLSYILKIEVSGDNLVVNACSDASGTLDGDAITPVGTAPRVYTFPANKQYFQIKGNGETNTASRIDIYYASATVEYMTQFCTRYDITGVTKSGTAVTGGTLSSNYNSACEGKSVELEAVVSTGYQFNGWTIKKTADPTQDVTSTLLGANASSLTPPAFSMPAYAITVSASITEKEVTGWTWKQALPDATQIAIPSKVMLYVGQRAEFDLIEYDPSDVLAEKKGYGVTKEDAYLTQNAKAADYYKADAKAAVESTTLTLTSTSNGSVQEVINIQIKALPAITFEDHVHSVVFSAVAATIDETDKRVVYLTKTTPTTSDFSGTTYNTCEEQHEHLVGWIESSWADEHPNATHSEIAGAGAGVFYTAGASIDVEAQNGKTFYAVWSKIE